MNYWILMAALLIAQNFAFTVVSRARNSGSDAFHATAAVFSNGIWVVVNFLLVAKWTEVLNQKDPFLFAAVALFYVAFTVIGSVYGGRISRRFFEKGNRRVGHYEDKKDPLTEIEALWAEVGMLNAEVLHMGRELDDRKTVIDPYGALLP